ncbi:MAG: alpha/beta fold hydrolase [Sulfitobacter sp.]
MANIILVHGSWHWAGCFYKLEQQLQGLGHTTQSINNASHGDDNTAWDAIDSMATYTASLRAAIEASSESVVLVGHSMGGVSLSYLAEEIPGKIAKLIYLTAFMTAPGKTANDYIMGHAENPVNAPLFGALEPVNDRAGIRLKEEAPDQIREAFYGDCSDEDVALPAKNATVINTSIPNIYTPTKIAVHERHYIQCTNDRAISLQAQNEMCDDVPGTQIHGMETSHSPFYSQPEVLAKIISGISG